jgi:N-acetylglucosamine kinase-like BadF-type ATPase
MTRALLATLEGQVVGAGRAGGANVWSSGTAVSQVIAEAVRGAMADVDPSNVAASVVGMAGSLTGEDAAADVDTAWRMLRLPRPPWVVSDVLTGFAAGTTAADGAVVVGGTGSIAAAIRGREVRRTAGGHGWLLGDEGSAVWLGVAGLKAALQGLEGRGPDSRLGETLPAALGIEPADTATTVVGIVRAVHARPPAQLGRLAPVVVEAAMDGDSVAHALVEATANQLVELARAVIDDAPASQVVVLTGSLLTEVTPIRSTVRSRLAERWPAAICIEARSGEAGAAALAIERYTGIPIVDSTLDRLRATP